MTFFYITGDLGSVALSEATMTDELAGGGAAFHPETKFLDLRLLLRSIGSLFRTMGPLRPVPPFYRTCIIWSISFSASAQIYAAH